MTIFPMNYTQSVTISPYLSENEYGDRTYGTPVTVPAILTWSILNIIDFQGHLFISNASVTIPIEYSVDEKDKITLPNGSSPDIGSISKIFDEEAEEYIYTKIYLGKSAPGG
jgi:hypothetical protein